MDRYFEIKKRLLDISKNDENLHAVIAVGSSARSYAEADEYSDIDLVLICNNPNQWLFGNLPAELGEMKISFLESTLSGASERRILYQDSLDVDLIPLTPDQIEAMINSGVVGAVMSRGYEVLYDDGMDVQKLIDNHIEINVHYSVMPEKGFINTVNDFWYHTVWTSKKILRGELWTAKMCVDAYMKNHLLKMIELNRVKDENIDVWHSGRFLEKWAGEETVQALADCFAHYEKVDIISALFNTAELFGALARSAAQKCSYEYPKQAEEYALSLLKDAFCNL